MRKLAAFASLLLVVACGPSEPAGPGLSKEPISVRGWIVDVEGGANAPFQTVETEAFRKTQLYQTMNLWVENAPYVSGGVAETGAFLLLDVPPGNITIVFSAPGAPAAKLVLRNIPGNADVFVPAILLRRDSVGLLDPKGVMVRVAATIDHAKPTGATASVAGVAIPVMNTPIREMSDRHDFPVRPAAARPLGIVR
ncbi:MAG: hypothetical protein M3041_02085 [Acidobacteriota bacterium]|nr:hypothetical protein [Acidobacteriota bacterium]